MNIYRDIIVALCVLAATAMIFNIDLDRREVIKRLETELAQKELRQKRIDSIFDQQNKMLAKADSLLKIYVPHHTRMQALLGFDTIEPEISRKRKAEMRKRLKQILSRKR